jgi:hypothetical protein
MPVVVRVQGGQEYSECSAEDQVCALKVHPYHSHPVLPPLICPQQWCALLHAKNLALPEDWRRHNDTFRAAACDSTTQNESLALAVESGASPRTPFVLNLTVRLSLRPASSLVCQNALAVRCHGSFGPSRRSDTMAHGSRSGAARTSRTGRGIHDIVAHCIALR